MLAAGNSRLKLFQIAFIQLGEQAGQMVELVNSFVFSQAGVELSLIHISQGTDAAPRRRQGENPDPVKQAPQSEPAHKSSFLSCLLYTSRCV